MRGHRFKCFMVTSRSALLFYGRGHQGTGKFNDGLVSRGEWQGSGLSQAIGPCPCQPGTGRAARGVGWDPWDSCPSPHCCPSAPSPSPAQDPSSSLHRPPSRAGRASCLWLSLKILPEAHLLPKLRALPGQRLCPLLCLGCRAPGGSVAASWAWVEPGRAHWGHFGFSFLSCNGATREVLNSGRDIAVEMGG